MGRLSGKTLSCCCLLGVGSRTKTSALLEPTGLYSINLVRTSPSLVCYTRYNNRHQPGKLFAESNNYYGTEPPRIPLYHPSNAVSINAPGLGHPDNGTIFTVISSDLSPRRIQKSIFNT